MKRWLLRIGLLLLVIILIVAAYGFYQLRSRGFLRLPSYETVPPQVPAMESPAILVFSKTNSFIHREAIPAAEAMYRTLAEENGWAIYITENGAVHNPEDLARFDAIVWNNVTGDVLNEAQQKAFVEYLKSGGGWVGIHGSGDSSSDWDWYNQQLIGAEFIGHPMNPQFQEATVLVEKPADHVMEHLDREWVRTDEWYSYAESPRHKGMEILATLDESTYSPRFFDENIGMGDDHPIVWRHCVGEGRALYSAMGHTGESYSEPRHIEMLERATEWAAGLEGAGCPPR